MLLPVLAEAVNRSESAKRRAVALSQGGALVVLQAESANGEKKGSLCEVERGGVFFFSPSCSAAWSISDCGCQVRGTAGQRRSEANEEQEGHLLLMSVDDHQSPKKKKSGDTLEQLVEPVAGETQKRWKSASREGEASVWNSVDVSGKRGGGCCSADQKVSTVSKSGRGAVVQRGGQEDKSGGAGQEDGTG